MIRRALSSHEERFEKADKICRRADGPAGRGDLHNEIPLWRWPRPPRSLATARIETFTCLSVVSEKKDYFELNQAMMRWTSSFLASGDWMSSRLKPK